MILRVPVNALLLRVAWIERRDLRANLLPNPSRPQMILLRLSHR